MLSKMINNVRLLSRLITQTFIYAYWLLSCLQNVNNKIHNQSLSNPNYLAILRSLASTSALSIEPDDERRTNAEHVNNMLPHALFLFSILNIELKCLIVPTFLDKIHIFSGSSIFYESDNMVRSECKMHYCDRWNVGGHKLCCHAGPYLEMGNNKIFFNLFLYPILGVKPWMKA